MPENPKNEESVLPLSSLTGQSEHTGDEAGEAGVPTSGGAESLLTSSASKKRSPWAGMFVIVLVIVVAAAGLYFMRRIGVGGNFTMTDLDIEIPTAVANAENYEVVMRDISEQATEKQVPLEKVKKNPFVIARKSTPTDDETANDRDGERERLERDRAERARLAALDKALKSLKLQSIMGGSRPMAMINGELRQVGDRVGEFFRVTSIDDRSVNIETDEGESYTLRLGDED